MLFTRHFTSPNSPVESQIKWKTINSKITAANGEIIFEMNNIEVPESWSQQATNILAQKYFRKAGVSISRIKVSEENIPQWLWKSIPIEAGNGFTYTSETSAKQVFHRLAGAWTYWGWKEGIFCQYKDGKHFWGAPGEDYQGAEEAARIFYDETYFILANQIAAPNSPQFFNTGLHWAYGIEGDANGQWANDKDGNRFLTSNSYEYPQVHACYIQPITDNLVEPGGIMDLWTKEARLFKHGSGTGTNFSNIRSKGEKLSGGGVSSGLMSFLKIGDVVAGSIASGGTTRRAAKLVCLDLDHPEIEDFIDWKMKEERKARALVLGSELLNDGGEIYSDKFEGEAINTVSAQNANNSIRITDDFLDAVEYNLDWDLTSRTTGEIVKTLKAKYLFDKICHAAWACADPGLQFHDTINLWHTCKNDGEIKASNPCSEYMFLDDTACNLASLNLGKFLKPDLEFDIKSFEHVTRLFTIVLEISVFMASFPSKEIAQNSYLYRTLGLGYANLGGILMRLGLGYDSDEGRNWAQDITALLHGISYLTSAEIAKELGPFQRFEANRNCMLNVIEKHNTNLVISTERLSSEYIRKEVLKIWKELIKKESFRNAQTTLLAPTGTISLLMGCGDFTGIEPCFSLISYKQLSGGGVMKIVNEQIPQALHTLGYTPAQIQSILQHISETGTIEGWKVNGHTLPEEHLKVFDCANPSQNGTRFLRPEAHILMMAAVQPFLSGAISKTCNLPNSATIQDVKNIYREAHRLGLKSIAIYRDGSKLTQPLSSNSTPRTKEISPPKSEKEFNKITEENSIELDKIARTLGYVGSPPQRNHLPLRRKGYTQKVRIDGQSIYLKTGEYPDGTLGEIWSEISKEGSTVRAILGAFCKLTSISLQFGVPLEQLVKAFVYTKFEPAGIVEGHDKIKITTSILDFIFRELAINYLHKNEFSNINLPNGIDKEEEEIQISIIPQQIENHLALGQTIPTTPFKPLNFTGNQCPNCGHATLIQTGTCVECTTCFQNTGCG